MLALATSCAPPDWPLDRTVDALRELGAGTFALHRGPDAREARALRTRDVVAVFDEPGAADVLHVLEARPANPDDREASLEALCRDLHRFREHRLALRTPPAPDHHPAPEEIALVAEALPFCGYWHDVARGGPDYAEAAGGLLRGVSFDPLRTDDLHALRDLAGRALPAVVWLAPGTPRDEVAEAWRRARGTFA